MSKLKNLTPKELGILHEAVVKMRIDVLTMVQEYNYSVTQLVSRTFEHDIEAEYGRKLLTKQVTKS